MVLKKYFVLLFLIGKNNRHGIGEKVAVFDWGCGRKSAPREGQKIPCCVRYRREVREAYMNKQGLPMSFIYDLSLAWVSMGLDGGGRAHK